jgi:hypothetical protein
MSRFRSTPSIIGFYHNDNQWIHAPSIQLIELVGDNNEGINHRNVVA